MSNNENLPLPSVTLWSNGETFDDAFHFGFLPFDNEDIAEGCAQDGDEGHRTFAATFAMVPDGMEPPELGVTAMLWATGIDKEDAFAQGFIPFDCEDTARQVAHQCGEEVFEALFVLSSPVDSE